MAYELVAPEKDGGKINRNRLHRPKDENFSPDCRSTFLKWLDWYLALVMTWSSEAACSLVPCHRLQVDQWVFVAYAIVCCLSHVDINGKYVMLTWTHWELFGDRSHRVVNCKKRGPVSLSQQAQTIFPWACTPSGWPVRSCDPCTLWLRSPPRRSIRNSSIKTHFSARDAQKKRLKAKCYASGAYVFAPYTNRKSAIF